MLKKGIFLLVAAGLVALFTFVDSGSAQAEQPDAVVKIAGFAFAPKNITVEPGTKVTWINEDPVAHTATQEGKAPSFNSGLLNKGESYSFTFTKPGTYNYYCVPHPYMKATVTVKDKETPATPTPGPTPDPEDADEEEGDGEMTIVQKLIIAAIVVGIATFLGLGLAFIMGGMGGSTRR